MPNGDIVINTENHGVMFFNKSKLVEQHEQLSLTDLKSIIDQRDVGYSATCVFTFRGYFTVLSESENEKRLIFSKRDHSRNYVEFSEFQVDRPHPIMKINVHGDGECV